MRPPQGGFFGYNRVMFWADKIAKEIIDSGQYKPYWVDDMKTPSGRIHVGSLRGVIIHDIVYKALLDAKQKATFTYVFEDHDPMDGLPVYLEEKHWSQYLGQPLFTIPSPDPKFSNYGQYFALEFQEVFNKIGCEPTIIWMSEVYKSGKMNDSVRLCLDNASEIRKIYQEMYKKKLPDSWYPFQVVCPKCGKISTARVTDWGGKEVSFTCVVDAVTWTRGCGHSGKTSPFSDKDRYAGKLSWKVEWPVKWKVIGVTVEGAGKDHMSRGGSHDVAKEVCARVIHYPVPYPVPYEFFLIGGKKMSSSKGVGSSAKEVSDVLSPYLLRFLFTRTDYNQAINFDPMGNLYIPDLFDEYDRCWQEYNQGGEENLVRAFELSQLSALPDKQEKLFIPRFRDIANFTQLPNIHLLSKFEQIKGSTLTNEEKNILKERLTYAYVWLSKYAPDEYRYQISIKAYSEINLTEDQWAFLNDLVRVWEEAQDPEALQSEIFKLAKTKAIDLKKAFEALYIVTLGKSRGPRAGWLLKKFPKEVIVDRLTLNKQKKTAKSETKTVVLKKPEYFSIDPLVKSKYPSVSIGIALISGASIAKSNPAIEKEKQAFLSSLDGLTTERIGTYPEIVSYRKLYRQMGIDWHSRRPSPEALLRRVALGKGLYNVNICVDAYNLVVMKHRISVGAFDADNVQFPTVLRFAGEGDELLLLGDSEVTKYTSKELAYYDKEGGYNIDFNFRDAQRTKVTEDTKNIWINVDGVFDISSAQVEKSLNESIEMILHFCGGTVEFVGVVK